MNSTTPETEVQPVSEAEASIIRERLKTLDEDEKTAAPWPEVRKRIVSKSLAL